MTWATGMGLSPLVAVSRAPSGPVKETYQRPFREIHHTLGIEQSGNAVARIGSRRIFQPPEASPPALRERGGIAAGNHNPGVTDHQRGVACVGYDTEDPASHRFSDHVRESFSSC